MCCAVRGGYRAESRLAGGVYLVRADVLMCECSSCVQCAYVTADPGGLELAPPPGVHPMVSIVDSSLVQNTLVKSDCITTLVSNDRWSSPAVC